MKRKITIPILLWMLSLSGAIQAQAPMLRGRVLSQSDSLPLVGATVLVKHTLTGGVTDLGGEFGFPLSPGEYTLVVSYIGFRSKELLAVHPSGESLEIVLEAADLDLRAYELVSTGYQQIPRERATGSFVQIDEELVNRRISPDIISRLGDVTPGLIFNRTNVDRKLDIDIRGRSTIFGNSQPLIVIDNFPYDGDLSTLNPNDVESITVLKDAAASSIWGVKAANGVIVINTKRGRKNQPTQFTFNGNLTALQPSDMFYLPVMNAGEVLEAERLLFQRGYWDNQKNSLSRPPIPIGAETLLSQRDGLVSDADAAWILGKLASNDLRRDLQDEMYRTAVNRQYSLQAQGGSEKNRFFYGLGLDQNSEALRHNSNRRVSLNTRQLFSLGERLEVDAGVYYVHYSQDRPNPGPQSVAMTATRNLPVYYTLRDENGLPAITPKDYRQQFSSSAVEKGLLDWEFRPLSELASSTVQTATEDIRINTGLRYKAGRGFELSGSYQYWRANTRNLNYRPEHSYFARNLINQFTQVGQNGGLQRAIPLGGIADMGSGSAYSHSLRLQTDYVHRWGEHEIVALGGGEIKSLTSQSATSRLYGYDMETATNLPVDQVTLFRNYAIQAQQLRIPFNTGVNGFFDRYVSFFANASYTWKGKYTLSGSGRKDMSNIFGVDTNMKGVPLFSVGGAWLLGKEEFYRATWMPYSRLRLTYGYNGNVDNSLSALAVAGFSGSNLLGLPSGLVISHPNPELRWERLGMLNLGYDFAVRNDIISGTFEVFHKRATDLIGTTGFPPSSGISQFRGNYAQTEGWGMDFNVSSWNIRRAFQWRTDFFYSSIREKVTAYERKEPALTYARQGAGMGALNPVPLEGLPLFSVYSFASAGLDPDTGNPRGFLNGEPSTNVAAVISNTKPEDLIFHGSARPTSFGAMMNTFIWKGFSLSANISYRLGYYYRRNSVNYTAVLQGQGDHADYGYRWRAPGDEVHTFVPSIPGSPNANRDNFYLFSEHLVERGDHVRFQDVRVSYSMGRGSVSWLPFGKMELYLYANNVGIIWKASNDVLDPDFQTMRPPKSISMGLRVDF